MDEFTAVPELERSQPGSVESGSRSQTPALSSGPQKRGPATQTGDQKAKKAKTNKKLNPKEQVKNSNSRASSQPPTPNAEPNKGSQKARVSASATKKAVEKEYPVPIRLNLPPYKPEDLTALPRLPAFITPPTCSSFQHPQTGEEIELYSTDDHPFNRRGFRYIPCEASPEFPALGYRQIELPPYIPRVSYEDMSSHILVDRETSTIVSTEKGYRTARANVGVREGRWYWECVILKGNTGPEDGNIRIGWTRREASLETPVGFDAYGYGVRDVTGQKMYISRGSNFMKEPFKAGDVIGLYISLPPISYQLQAANSAKGKAPAKLLKDSKSHEVSNVIRDRFPTKYKGQLYFEQYECVPVKHMQDLLNQSSSDDAAAREKELREQGLPHSSIRIYKNGKYVGTPFERLLPFLPPHSAPLTGPDARVVDDGQLGYFPSISVYRGGVAQFNFGPDFHYFPADLRHEAKSADILKSVRPLSERYAEQIAEDVLWDIIDEVNLEIGKENDGSDVED
ncbi:hypothetical protein BZA70DRAFT_239711 [Myxozyma melibiosi]|uniref:B30.2/SPRY domain-containing protein n=1 Tax=Myxozyma melibiosi TaxID=54550 RepID=A0ABR1F3I0_9ASCO